MQPEIPIRDEKVFRSNSIQTDRIGHRKASHRIDEESSTQSTPLRLDGLEDPRTSSMRSGVTKGTSRLTTSRWSNE